MNYKEFLFENILNIQKPSRYIGGEYGSIIKQDAKIRFAFCFPDRYEIGMSNLAMQILYGLINQREEYSCERVFMPAQDFEDLLKSNDVPLFSLETKTPVKNFDFIGFTLGYELCYTNILSILELSDIPIFSKDRTENHPVIIAGGCCACNPTPLSDFIDLFILGEGEEVTLELLDLYTKCESRCEFLEKSVQIEGVYNPALGNKAKKRIVRNIGEMYSPENFIVPYGEVVHDRASVEVLRGCIRGCRFCQAGFLYRPYREKPSESIISQSKTLCENTGYEELSLISLSTSDHSEINSTMENLLNYSESRRISLALPSMRIDSFSPQLAEKLMRVRKTGITFAPEAGTQRLRDVINKNLTEEEILSACRNAFSQGYSSVKLYFMLGLPTETDEDIIGITDLTFKIDRLYLSMGLKGLTIAVSCATFVPKPFTPFQFEPQASRTEILRRQQLLRDSIKSKRVRLSVHEPSASILECVLARGGKEIGNVIYEAYKNGCKFDAWDEFFDFGKWLYAFEKCGINPEEYASYGYSYDESLPWDNLDYLVGKEFLISENQKAKNAIATPNCRDKCGGCGAGKCSIPKPQIAENPQQTSSSNEYARDHKFYPVRVTFTKTGTSAFISHLDFSRAMQRIIKRSGLCVKYTEGFNPRYAVAFPLALPLGLESICEIMDFKLEYFTEYEDIKTALNKVMPLGMEVLSVTEPTADFKEIHSADYKVTGNFPKFIDFINQESIIISKKAKQRNRKVMKDIDIKPNLEVISMSEDAVVMRLPASTSGCITPIQVMGAYSDFVGENVSYKALKISLNVG